MEAYLDTNVWKRLKFNFAFSRYIQSHPYIWKNETKSVAAIPVKSIDFLHWCFSVTLAFLYCIFVQFRSVELFLDPCSSTIECVLIQVMVVYHATNAIMEPTYLFQPDEVPRFANTHIKFLRAVSRAYKMNVEQVKKLYGPFGAILGIYQACFWTNQCFLVVIALARPWSPDLLSSLMPNARGLGWQWRIPFGILHAYLLATIAQTFLMLLGFEILVILTTNGLLSILR